METITDNHPGTQATRKGRRSIAQQIYSITSVCAEREKIFSNYFNARLVAKALHSPKLWPDAKCLAWVVMPDHIHLLLQLGDKESLPLVIQRIKSLTAYSINIESHRWQPVWQRGYYDHAIRSDEDVHAAARYLLNNPIRAGIAENLGDYPYWSLAEEWFEGGNFIIT